MLTVDDLKEWGADVEEGLGRCMNNADFYIKLVGMTVADRQLDDLAAALAEKDLDRGFELAHALKGMYGNLSLTPIYKPVYEMTELLRARTDTDYSALIGEAQKQKAELDRMTQ